MSAPRGTLAQALIKPLAVPSAITVFPASTPSLLWGTVTFEACAASAPLDTNADITLSLWLSNVALTDATSDTSNARLIEYEVVLNPGDRLTRSCDAVSSDEVLYALCTNGSVTIRVSGHLSATA